MSITHSGISLTFIYDDDTERTSIEVINTTKIDAFLFVRPVTPKRKIVDNYIIKSGHSLLIDREIDISNLCIGFKEVEVGTAI